MEKAGAFDKKFAEKDRQDRITAYNDKLKEIEDEMKRYANLLSNTSLQDYKHPGDATLLEASAGLIFEKYFEALNLARQFEGIDAEKQVGHDFSIIQYNANRSGNQGEFFRQMEQISAKANEVLTKENLDGYQNELVELGRQIELSAKSGDFDSESIRSAAGRAMVYAERAKLPNPRQQVVENAKLYAGTAYSKNPEKIVEYEKEIEELLAPLISK